MSLPPCVGEKMRETAQTMGVSTCLHYAVDIQRSRDPKQWGAAIEAIPEECQDECREYLRGIWRRLQVAKGCK